MECFNIAVGVLYTCNVARCNKLFIVFVSHHADQVLQYADDYLPSLPPYTRDESANLYIALLSIIALAASQHYLQPSPSNQYTSLHSMVWSLSDQDGVSRCSIEHLQLWGGRRLEEVDFNLDAVLNNRSACSKSRPSHFAFP